MIVQELSSLGGGLCSLSALVIIVLQLQKILRKTSLSNYDLQKVFKKLNNLNEHPKSLQICSQFI